MEANQQQTKEKEIEKLKSQLKKAESNPKLKSAIQQKLNNIDKEILK